MESIPSAKIFSDSAFRSVKPRIEKAAVLGAGTMGARIAAHFANAGLPCILLDIVPPNLAAGSPAGDRNKIVRGLEVAVLTGKPLSEWHRSHAFLERPFPSVMVGLMMT